MDVETVEVSTRQQSGRRDFGIGAGDRVGVAIVLAFAVAIVSLFPMSGTRLAQAAPQVHHTTQSARAPQHQASTYSCLNPHCYGDIKWEVTPDISIGAYGAMVQQQVPWLVCSDPGCVPVDMGGLGYHVSNEMWLIDTSAWAVGWCGGVCWIEEGVGTYGSSFFYFWADQRPCLVIPSLGYAEHFVGFASADSGYFISSTINNHSSDSVTRDCSHKANWSWTQSIWSEHAGYWEFLNALSTNMPFWPDRVQVGLEVYGTGNQSASLNQYQNVQYILNGVWNLVDQSGTNNPDTCRPSCYGQNGPQAS